MTTGDYVELRVPARADMFATVRALASDVAQRADFDLDRCSDVRMAVDEACNQIAARTGPEQPLRVEFSMHDGLLRVTMTARAAHGGLDTAGFGWRVLATLTDELETEYGGGVHADELVIRMVAEVHVV
jgi:serine/threonine-protein kinase RsbW